MKRYPTLEAINMVWVSKFHLLGSIALLGGLVISIVLVLFQQPWAGLGFVIGAALSIVIGVIGQACFYRLVRCPNCHEHLNRFKNGKNVPAKQAWTQLGNGYGCRHCGWKPDMKVSGER